MNPTDEKQRVESDAVEVLAIQYLASKKHWDRDDYRLELKEPRKPSLAVIWAIYLDDERKPVPGAGKSVVLHIDRKQQRVVQELAFQ